MSKGAQDFLIFSFCAKSEPSLINLIHGQDKPNMEEREEW